MNGSADTPTASAPKQAPVYQAPAAHYGLRGLLMPHLPHAQIEAHGGLWQWAKANPGTATIGLGLGAVNLLGGDTGMAGEAARQFHSVIQPNQFGGH